MRIIKAILFGGVALVAAPLCACADGLPATGSQLDSLDLDNLAATAKPVLPPATSTLVMKKTAQPEVPGLPLTAREKAAFGSTATTIGIVPAGGGQPGPSVSWSGYVRAGVVYHGGSGN